MEDWTKEILAWSSAMKGNEMRLVVWLLKVPFEMACPGGRVGLRRTSGGTFG